MPLSYEPDYWHKTNADGECTRISGSAAHWKPSKWDDWPCTKTLRDGYVCSYTAGMTAAPSMTPTAEIATMTAAPSMMTSAATTGSTWILDSMPCPGGAVTTRTSMLCNKYKAIETSIASLYNSLAF